MAATYYLRRPVRSEISQYDRTSTAISKNSSSRHSLWCIRGVAYIQLKVTINNCLVLASMTNHKIP